MGDSLPPHQAIVADEYWETVGELPRIPFLARELDEFNAVHRFAQYGAAKVQWLYRQAMDSGHLTTPVQPGDELPTVERGGGLVRVVEDVRQFPVRDPALKRFSSRKNAKDDSPEQFDAIAQRMLVEHLYRGEIARTTLNDEDPERRVRIWRMVYYLTGSKSGAQLEGIWSKLLFTPPNRIGMNIVAPPIVVGEAYRRDRAGTYTSKIVIAEVLIAGGSKRRLPRKALFNVKPRFAFSG